jgi:serum/glucocorticoid-regulated kinase 2
MKAATSEFIPLQLQSQPRPGILIVTLHEGIDLSALDQYRQVFNNLQYESCEINSLWQRHKSKVASSFRPPFYRRLLPYALLNFDKSQVTVDSFSGTTESPLWAGDEASCKFDVSRAAKLTVKNPNSFKGSQDIFLGIARINPLLDDKKPPGTEWFNIQNDTGKVRIGVEYVENRTSKMGALDFLGCLGRDVSGNKGSISQVRKKDTQRLYAFREIRRSDVVSQYEVADTVLSRINSPFTVPLKLAFQSPGILYLFLPLVSGGHLFYYLQREQRFDVSRSKFYAAELLCALECLHEFDIICCDLKPWNILLDYSGHITVCDFGLCNLGIDDEDRTVSGTLVYPAPELLLCRGYNKMVDWWTLGVFLYEMLIGLPPFYDEDTEESHRKILCSEPLQVPDLLHRSAKDILSRLLDRMPDQRLGANGTAEIKDHPFFHNIDWHKLLQRNHEPTFKPNNIAMVFRQHEYPTHFEYMQRAFPGLLFNQPVRDTESKSEIDTSEKTSTLAEDRNEWIVIPGKDAAAEALGSPVGANPSVSSDTSQAANEADDGWVLIWEEAPQAFYFSNRFINAKQPVSSKVPDSAAPVIPPLVAQKPTQSPGYFDPITHSDHDSTVRHFPSQNQCKMHLKQH